MIGVRDGKDPHELLEEINTTTHTITSIKPEYNYTVLITVLTEGGYESEAMNLTFISQAGGKL